MVLSKFCFCCLQESNFYKNSKTGHVAYFCIKCNSTYTPAEKRKRESLNIIKILSSSKEINEKCSRL